MSCIAEVPGAYGGAAPYAATNALAAIAAARALGTPQQTVVERLGAFDPASTARLSSPPNSVYPRVTASLRSKAKPICGFASGARR